MVICSPFTIRYFYIFPLKFVLEIVAKILYLILDDKATLRFAGDGKPDGFLSYKLKNQTKNFLTPTSSAGDLRGERTNIKELYL